MTWFARKGLTETYAYVVVSQGGSTAILVNNRYAPLTVQELVKMLRG